MADCIEWSLLKIRDPSSNYGRVKTIRVKKTTYFISRRALCKSKKVQHSVSLKVVELDHQSTAEWQVFIECKGWRRRCPGVNTFKILVLLLTELEILFFY